MFKKCICLAEKKRQLKCISALAKQSMTIAELEAEIKQIKRKREEIMVYLEERQNEYLRDELAKLKREYDDFPERRQELLNEKLKLLEEISTVGKKLSARR